MMGAIEVQCLATGRTSLASLHFDPCGSDLVRLSCESLPTFLYLNEAHQSIGNPLLRFLLFPACAVCSGVFGSFWPGSASSICFSTWSEPSGRVPPYSTTCYSRDGCLGCLYYGLCSMWHLPVLCHRHLCEDAFGALEGAASGHHWTT